MQSAEAIIFFFLQKKLSNVKYKISFNNIVSTFFLNNNFSIGLSDACMHDLGIFGNLWHKRLKAVLELPNFRKMWDILPKIVYLYESVNKDFNILFLCRMLGIAYLCLAPIC